MAAAAAIMAIAGQLSAQSPNRHLSEPTRAGSKYTQGNNWKGPGASHWADYGDAAPPAENSPIYDSPMMPEGSEFLEPEPMYEDGPAYPYSSGYWWRDGTWYAASDFVVWHRTRPFGLVLGYDGSVQPPAPEIIFFPVPELNKNQTSMGVEAGNRTTIGRVLMRDLDNRDHSIEATYLGFNEWEGHAGLVGLEAFSLFSRLDREAPGFNNASAYDIFYQSQFHSLELNYRIRNRPGRDRMIMGPDGQWSRQLVPGPTQSLIVGLRGLTIDERWQWLSARNGVNPDVYSGNMLINTDNNLLGVQIGGDLLGVHDSWFWGVRGTAGVYCNFAEGNYHLAAIDTQQDDLFINSQAHSQSCAFFGELSFVAGVNLTDRIVLRTSWDMALAGGLALASDQASFDTYMAARVPSLNEGGQIFYTGLSVGLEAFW